MKEDEKRLNNPPFLVSKRKMVCPNEIWPKLSLSNGIYLKNGWSIFILLSPVFCPCLKDDTF